VVDTISEMKYLIRDSGLEEHNTAILCGVVDWITILHSVRGLEMNFVAQFLQQLDAWVTKVGADYYSSRNPIYWQALYILASTHQNLFPQPYWVA
jgi:hypothetical protein